MLERIKKLHLEARKERNELRKNLYSLILGEIQLAETRGAQLGESGILQIIRKLKVNCEENAKRGMVGAAEEALLCEELLPGTVSQDEIRKKIDSEEILVSARPMSMMGKYLGEFRAGGIEVDPRDLKQVIEDILAESKKKEEDRVKQAYAEAGEEVPGEYKPYQHVEKLSSTSVAGILDGKVSVFPKIDGSNAKIWLDAAGMHYGSRRRELSLTSDNAGFMGWAVTQPNIEACLEELNGKFGPVALFGEWLVKHTIRTYTDDSWRRFWAFDVFVPHENRYVSYDEYKPVLEAHGIDYIPRLAELENPSKDELMDLANKNDFLIKEGEGVGEGIVIKRYDYKNKWQRIVWAKIVLSDFKDKSGRKPKKELPKGNCEDKVVEEFYTRDIADKVLANVLRDNNGEWESKLCSRVIMTCWYDFVTECTWDIIKKFKNPTIDYKLLQRMVNQKTKDHLPDIF